MIYITGDTHGNFKRIKEFCHKYNTTKNDYLIILGDSGINFFQDKKAILIKEFISKLPITLLCVYGNHEKRVEHIPSYKSSQLFNNTVYYEENFPNIYFTKDGEVYKINNNKILVCGGAYSIDKFQRIKDISWWEDEQPTKEIKKLVIYNCKKYNWNIDYVFTHTCPRKYIPPEIYFNGFNQNKIDKSTEIFLDAIEQKLNYKKWYCGHFHIDKIDNNIIFMFNNYRELGK